VFFKPGETNLQTLSLTAEALNHQEVQSKEQLTKEVQEFLTKLNLKKSKGILVLSPKLIYQKVITPDSKDPDKEKSTARQGKPGESEADPKCSRRQT